MFDVWNIHTHPEPILRDVFSGWEDGHGIFDALRNVSGDIPWANDENIDDATLDIAYFGNHSGGKFCAPVVKTFLTDEEEVSQSGRTKIAKILVAKYLTGWKHLWEANEAVYSPIHNYDMTEERTRKKANSEAESARENQSHTGTDTLQHGLTETTTHGMTNTQNIYKFGLNTDPQNPKQSDRNVSTDGGQTVVADSGSDVQTKNLADSKTSNRNLAGAEDETEQVHRAGNIGVTTTQQMIQQERELWIWNYFDQVFTDLDNELALAFHDPCRV